MQGLKERNRRSAANAIQGLEIGIKQEADNERRRDSNPQPSVQDNPQPSARAGHGVARDMAFAADALAS